MSGISLTVSEDHAEREGSTCYLTGCDITYLTNITTVAAQYTAVTVYTDRAVRGYFGFKLGTVLPLLLLRMRGVNHGREGRSD